MGDNYNPAYEGKEAWELYERPGELEKSFGEFFGKFDVLTNRDTKEKISEINDNPLFQRYFPKRVKGE